jgi:hypothetical protein
MNTKRDPRLLHGADIRQWILPGVEADIAALGKGRRVGPVTAMVTAMVTATATMMVLMLVLIRNAATAFDQQIDLGWV